MIRIFPKLDENDLYVRLFHKAVASQWSSEDVDWEAPVGLSPRQAQALTRILTPVYLGEQTAMNGAATTLPSIAGAGETTAQLYLSTFLLDEARHFEALTRLYRRLGHNPVELRELPEMLRYHHRLRQGDRYDWLWGILISDLFAREFYLSFSKVQPRALFGQMSARILVDESRHQAFAHAYLKNALPKLSPERRQALLRMRDELLQIMRAMNRHLRPDAEVLGIDGEAFVRDLERQIDAHSQGIGLRGDGRPPEPPEDGGDGPSWWQLIARKRAAVEAGDGISWPETAAAAREPGGPSERPAAAGRPGVPAERAPRRYWFGRLPQLAGECGGCVLELLCRTRLVRGATVSP
jgi:hypothetical protein